MSDPGLCFSDVPLPVVCTGQKGAGLHRNYRETFTTTASTNMSDMAMSVDPNQLFIFNLVAIVVLPLLTWLLTRDLAATLVMAGIHPAVTRHYL